MITGRGLQSNGKCPHWRKAEGDGTQKKRRRREEEARWPRRQNEALRLPVKECQQPPDAIRGKEQTLPEASERDQGPAGCWTEVPRTARGNVSYSKSPDLDG